MVHVTLHDPYAVKQAVNVLVHVACMVGGNALAEHSFCTYHACAYHTSYLPFSLWQMLQSIMLAIFFSPRFGHVIDGVWRVQRPSHGLAPEQAARRRIARLAQAAADGAARRLQHDLPSHRVPCGQVCGPLVGLQVAGAERQGGATDGEAGDDPPLVGDDARDSSRSMCRGNVPHTRSLELTGTPNG